MVRRHVIWVLKARLRLKALLSTSEGYALLPWAALAGLLGALATIAFRESIHAIQFVLSGHSGSLVEMAKALPWYWRVVMPAAGGLVAGLFLIWSRRVPAGAMSDYMEAVTIGDGRLPMRQSLLRSLSSLFTIASGGAIGREGSMVQLAALVASLLGRLRNFDAEQLRILVACGAAAGLTSAYNAPIAGAFFVTEIVIGSIVMRHFGPILVASVVANITMRELPGYRPAYEMPAFPAIFGVEVVLFIALGAFCGVISPQFLRLLNRSRKEFQRMTLPVPLKLAIGGLGVGIISIWVPEVWGNGYSVVNSLLHAQWVWSFVVVVLVLKIIATALTIGAGAVGGVFTPTLFVGAALGYLSGLVAHGLWPHATSDPFAYAMVGMGAFLAASTSAPLMAILMIFEMTLSYQVVLPLIVSCVVAYFVARSISDVSMYDVTIKRHRDATDRLRLRGMQMRMLIRPTETVLPMTAGFDQISSMFLEYPVKYVYVVDEAGRYQGVLALGDLVRVMLKRREGDALTARNLLRRDDVHVISPNMGLADALQRFMTHPGERLPVVDGMCGTLLGVVHKSSVLDAYARLGASM
ncbi:voltage-gated ClC-type chloride channel ClcB [Pandoraea eparura]|uniref:Voltage-gated ClC-type chloride channel ClcB n=1 Tax=Pandoraea eparura TaxID=2508291 RepID=A0A5E4RFS0_9BURK|nr:ClcB-like voltage-gated chloride channel protein [Pandoraea eparura]VVD61372.1 voltage-gated ClC-type chloride channel ClcB [Pandoraea eparura]